MSVIPVCLKAPEIKGNTKGNEHGESLCYVRNRFGFVTADIYIYLFIYTDLWEIMKNQHWYPKPCFGKGKLL